MKKNTILIVDDNPQWQKVLEEGLASIAQIIYTTNADETIKAIENMDIQCALVDIRLIDYDPNDKSGLSIMALLAKSNIPTIAMTAYGDVQTVRTAFIEHKVFDFIDKSKLSFTEIRNTVTNAIEMKKSLKKK